MLQRLDSAKLHRMREWLELDRIDEAAMRASGVAFTFVRPTGFMANLLAWAHTIKTEGVVRSSTGEGRRPCAAVTLFALIVIHDVLVRNWSGWFGTVPPLLFSQVTLKAEYSIFLLLPITMANCLLHRPNCSPSYST